ncbi:hypothetical protein [Acinetobacter bouvetii]|uniref:hypothetical protein n=1 Tax=Acinetobacter bouvetii TaxID=202951 RepID=UPI000367AB9D|nr:hypothetical protein [Acinetobacter bouvetii]
MKVDDAFTPAAIAGVDVNINKNCFGKPLSAMPTFALQPNEMSLVKLGLRQQRHGIFF